MRRTNRSTMVISVIVIAVILFLLLTRILTQVQDYQNLEAEGLKTLVPVDVKQTRSEIRVRRRTTEKVHNYVKFQVPIADKTYGFWMSTSEAYGENSYTAGQKAVKNQETIERYIFFNGEKIFYSKTASTVEEYIKEQVGREIKIIAVVAAFFLLSLIFQVLLGLRRLPAEADHVLQDQAETIVCRHNSFGFSLLMMVCVMFCVFFVPVTKYLVSEGNMAAILIGGVGVLFGVLAVVIFLMMLNRVLVIGEEEIIFRDSLGKVFCYSAGQVDGVNYIAVPRRDQLRIQTKEKQICINHLCVNFGEAKAFLERHYCPPL